MCHLLVSKLINGKWHHSALCGAVRKEGEGFSVGTDPRHVSCPKCKEMMNEREPS